MTDLVSATASRNHDAISLASTVDACSDPRVLRSRVCSAPTFVLSAVLALNACKKDGGGVHHSVPFSDDFDRADLGPDWWKSGGHWTIDQGTVYTTGADNAPLFLKVDLPNDVVVECDVKSETPLVDSKIELMNNGRDHASGYIFILGGWQNKISSIARLDEHGKDRQERTPTAVTGPKSYHWRIEKKAGDIRWYLDGKPYMTFDDKQPLEGTGHNRLSFSNWQNEVRYDHLRIWPYDQAPKINTSTTAQ